MTLNPQVWLGWGGHLFGEGTYQSMGANERKYNDGMLFSCTLLCDSTSKGIAKYFIFQLPCTI